MIHKLLQNWGVSYTTPRKWRISAGLPKIFKYTVHFDEEKFRELQEQGLNYSQIAKQLGISASAAQAYGAKQGFTTNYLKYESIEFTAEEFQIFLGTMYGDACMNKFSKTSNAKLSFAHSLKQQNYCFWKYKNCKGFVINLGLTLIQINVPIKYMIELMQLLKQTLCLPNTMICFIKQQMVKN